MMSVPPVVASALITRASPIPQINEPINVITITFGIIGDKIIREANVIIIDDIMVVYIVFKKKFMPKTIAPVTRRGVFNRRKIYPVFNEGFNLEIITTIPVSPPGAISTGSINKANPYAKRKLPKVKKTKRFNSDPYII